MKGMIRFALINMLLAAPMIMAFAQGRLEYQGDKAFDVHNFAKAARYYDAAFHKANTNEKKMALAYKAAKAYHRMNQLEKALLWYEDALGEERNNTEVLMAAADAAMRAGQAEKASAYLLRVLAINPVHPNARSLLEGIELWKLHRSIHSKIQIDKAPEGINSSFSDYAPRWLGNELVITSSRPSEGLMPTYDGRTMQDFSRLYLFISKTDGSFGEPIALPVGKNKNAGVFAWDAERKRVFFTSCSNRKQRCSILQAVFDPLTFSFSKPVVPSFVSKKYHYGHPFVSPDGKTLYFSAKLPGGYGNNDIYSVSLKPDGSFGLPANVGPLVNTSGEELFPSMGGDSILFFSSNGHLGYGGLDIYGSRISGAGYSRPKLLPPPFNTISDDFGLSLRPAGQPSGALSSNREGYGTDHIYFFHGCPMPVLVQGRAKDANTAKPLSGVMITLTLGAALTELKTGPDGHFSFYSCAPLQLKIEAAAEGYRTTELGIKLNAHSGTESVVLKLSRMAWPVSVSGVVVHRETGRPIANQPVRLIRPGMPERLTHTNATGFYVFDSVLVNKIYTIKVEREGFFNESRVVHVPETDKALVLNRKNGYDLDFELTPIILKKEIVINNIYYDFDKANLRETSKMELGKLVSLMRDNPAIRIQISSHTDERGRADYNERLSALRAQAVVDYLVQSGIHPSRLTAQGYGRRFPVVKNARTEEQHQANRRTTFQVLDLNAPVQQTRMPAHTQALVNKRLFFRVQFLLTSTKRNPDTDFIAISNLAPGLRIYEEVSGRLYRYEAGDRYSLPEAEALRNQIRAAGFADSFVVPYIDNQRVTMQQAKEFKP